jgi:hypothetical protein
MLRKAKSANLCGLCDSVVHYRRATERAEKSQCDVSLEFTYPLAHNAFNVRRRRELVPIPWNSLISVFFLHALEGLH